MPNVQGRPLHTRSLTIIISRMSESLWHARGDVIDLRKHSFVPLIDDIQPAGVIHMMSIDLDFDPESLRIREIAVDQPFVAIESAPATGGDCCRDPASRLLDLRGESLDSTFTKRLGALFGGPLGCSHLLTLFQLMASTIPRAVRAETNRVLREGTTQPIGKHFFRRSLFVDGHEQMTNDDQPDRLVEIALQLTDTHARPIGPKDRSTRRLERSSEIKAALGIDRKRFKIESLRARERHRSHATLGSATWTSHDELVKPLIGAPLIPGMARRVFALLGDDPQLDRLRDALLQLAPGFVQIAAALMDEHFAKQSPDTPTGRDDESIKSSSQRPADKPAVAAIGGNLDSCYMWRKEGHVAKTWGSRENTDKT
ncbi:MAG: DUF2889 domain-containing protein [Myxococcales bacterium]|nr:DUF2889 domain-containing protein [Myxococcales bacterium]HIK86431.1 DUF2889 domain-containing protein [Myxococcales bacterium]